MRSKKIIKLIIPLIVAVIAVPGYFNGTVSQSEVMSKVSAVIHLFSEDRTTSSVDEKKRVTEQKNILQAQQQPKTRHTSNYKTSQKDKNHAPLMPGMNIPMTYGWLNTQEGGNHKGHTLERHVGKNETYLRKRLTGETGLRPIRSASTFTEQSTAEDVVKRILLMYDNRILKWMKDKTAPDTLALEYRGGRNKVLGMGIRKGDTQLSPRYNAKAILRKHRSGYGVLTAYPM